MIGSFTLISVILKKRLGERLFLFRMTLLVRLFFFYFHNQNSSPVSAPTEWSPYIS
jgi:hypothetical protein